MTEKQFEKKRKNVKDLILWHTHSNTHATDIIMEVIDSLCKQYALSVLPQEKEIKESVDIRNVCKTWDRFQDTGFNQAIKQAKEKIGK